VDADRLRDVYSRGQRVERLLADDDLQAAFANVRAAILDKIEQTPVRDTEGLVQLRLMLKLLKDVRASLELAVRDGKLAAVQIEQAKRKWKVW
jgi:hypothetical protein